MASPPCLSAPLTPFLTQNLPPIGFFIRWHIIVGTKGFACMFKLWRRRVVSRSWWCPPACPPRRRSQTGPGSSQTCCLRCRSTEKKKNCYSKKLNFHSESFGELMTNENIPGLWDPIRNDWLRGREDCQYCSDCSGKESTRPEEMANKKSQSLKSTTTQPAVGGPKTFWEDQRVWRPKNLAAPRAEGTKQTKNLRWEDQNRF